MAKEQNLKLETRLLKKAKRAGFNRDEGDKGDEGNSFILVCHSGQSVARTRNPAMPACHVVAESVDGSSRTLK
ncbi:hypothetical protein MUP29_02180 [bacterium]|nr:hypothetical protein [bacterium]